MTTAETRDQAADLADELNDLIDRLGAVAREIDRLHLPAGYWLAAEEVRLATEDDLAKAVRRLREYAADREGTPT